MSSPYFIFMLTKLVGKNCIIDFQSKQCTFLDARFYSTENGGFVPSVTTILEAYPKGPEYYAWLKKVGEDADSVRDEAGRRGSKIHEITERYDAGEEISMLNENGYIDFTMLEWEMMGRYHEFHQRYKPNPILSEVNMVNAELGYAGTLDRVWNIEGKTYLVDIKTANTIYPSYWLQLAAYKKLLSYEQGANYIDGVAILWLNAKTRTEKPYQGKGWQLLIRDPKEEANDLELFNCTHKLWLAQNKDISPKVFSYSLTIKK